MGHRTVKRVALDFEWPIHTVWKGYLNPDRAEIECAACGGSGYAPAARALSDMFYSFHCPAAAWHDKITQDEVQALIDEGRLVDFTHTWSREAGWQRRADGYVPTAEEVNEDQHKRPGRMMGGHDAINRHILISARCRRLGIARDCPACGGHGVIQNPDETERARAEAWVEREPPAGPGWQLWETTSEGSPISPVCATAEALAAWCATAEALAAWCATAEALAAWCATAEALAAWCATAEALAAWCATAEALAAWCATGATIFGKERIPAEQWLAMFRAEDPGDAVDTGSFLIVEDGQMRVGLHKHGENPTACPTCARPDDVTCAEEK